MTLVEKLGTYDKDYWDFSDYRNETPIVKYPAVMVAPMQECIIREIIAADDSIHNIFDPFIGTGTVLCEGQKFGLDVCGFDINPLAVLISRVQLEGIPEKSAQESIQSLYARIMMLVGNVVPIDFCNIHKWFIDDIILSLSVIRKAIIGETDDRMRRFFWCCFAETVKRYSNTRTSTFKLHIKEGLQIDRLVDDSIDFFKIHIQEQYHRFMRKQDSTNTIDVRCGDSKQLLKAVSKESADLIYSSPPYGDNHTTVTYGQFSILPLLWIDQKDIDVWDQKILQAFTAIDTLSLGGKIKRNATDKYTEYVQAITKEKRKKVNSFFDDYETIFSLLATILKPGKLMVLTLGNRRVDNHEVRFDMFNDELAQKYGLELDSTIARNIVGKRMPSKVSNIENHGAVDSMSKEYVKVYRRSGKDGTKAI